MRSAPVRPPTSSAHCHSPCGEAAQANRQCTRPCGSCASYTMLMPSHTSSHGKASASAPACESAIPIARPGAVLKPSRVVATKLPRWSRTRACPVQPVRRVGEIVRGGPATPQPATLRVPLQVAPRVAGVAARSKGLVPPGRVRLGRVMVHTNATALEHDVVTRANSLQVGPHRAQVEEAELGLVPRHAVSRVGVEQELRSAALDAVAVPELPGAAFSSRRHDIGVAVVQARLPRLVLPKERAWLSAGDASHTRQAVGERQSGTARRWAAAAAVVAPRSGAPKGRLFIAHVCIDTCDPGNPPLWQRRTASCTSHTITFLCAASPRSSASAQTRRAPATWPVWSHVAPRAAQAVAAAAAWSGSARRARHAARASPQRRSAAAARRRRRRPARGPAWRARRRPRSGAPRPGDAAGRLELREVWQRVRREAWQALELQHTQRGAQRAQCCDAAVPHRRVVARVERGERGARTRHRAEHPVVQPTACRAEGKQAGQRTALAALAALATALAVLAALAVFAAFAQQRADGTGAAVQLEGMQGAARACPWKV
eukprot:scaffold71244_cov65-Phaeocystis_antarctica.AAC.9